MKLTIFIFLLIVFTNHGYCQEYVIQNKFSAYKFSLPQFKKGQESFDKYINTMITTPFYEGEYIADFILTTDTLIQLIKEWNGHIHITQCILVSSMFWKVATLNNIPVNSKIRITAKQIYSRSGIWTGSYQWIVNPEIAETYYEVGVRYTEENNFAEAIKYFDETLYLFSTDIDALYNRGVCKFKLHDKEGACDDWKMIKSLGKADADDLIARYCN